MIRLTILPVNPSLAQGRCCTRIGKSSLGRQRRLVGRLSSEQAASYMLRAAPALSQSYDKYIQTNIFINADLSPVAVTLAYESCKRRRENLHSVNSKLSCKRGIVVLNDDNGDLITGDNNCANLLNVSIVSQCVRDNSITPSLDCVIPKNSNLDNIEFTPDNLYTAIIS